ncbi:MAG: hypothetical protein Q9170_000625 [Blastenia crenularia]
MSTKVRMQLKKHYYANGKESHCRDVKDYWRTEMGISRLEAVAPPPHAIHHWNITKFCNKPTTFYCTEAGQRQGLRPGCIFRAVYKTWFRYYNNNPVLEHKHFFADWVQITATVPGTRDEIVKAHRLLNDPTASILTRMRQEPKDRTGPDKEARRQHVLFVLTGDDDNLSATISFDAIQSESSPLAQETVTEAFKPRDIIRVPSVVAMQFILDLQQRAGASHFTQGGQSN